MVTKTTTKGKKPANLMRTIAPMALILNNPLSHILGKMPLKIHDKDPGPKI
jgi:hypothetical protein